MFGSMHKSAYYFLGLCPFSNCMRSLSQSENSSVWYHHIDMLQSPVVCKVCWDIPLWLFNFATTKLFGFLDVSTVTLWIFQLLCSIGLCKPWKVQSIASDTRIDSDLCNIGFTVQRFFHLFYHCDAMRVKFFLFSTSALLKRYVPRCPRWTTVGVICFQNPIGTCQSSCCCCYCRWWWWWW